MKNIFKLFKKRYIIISIIVASIIIYLVYKMHIREAASIGIIGGADGPTTIYLSQGAVSTLVVRAFIIVVILIVFCISIIRRKHKKS